jgi:hypothetical protein
MDNIFLLNLKNTDLIAKVSICWTNQVSNYIWYLGKNGYPFTFINGCRIQLHRYIHWLNNNYWTNLYVDHINRDKLDATNINLREATAAENSYNKTYKNSNHNIKYNKSTNTYTVSIQKNKIKHNINNIKSIDDAKLIYKMMAEELFGTFAPI